MPVPLELDGWDFEPHPYVHLWGEVAGSDPYRNIRWHRICQFTMPPFSAGSTQLPSSFIAAGSLQSLDSSLVALSRYSDLPWASRSPDPDQVWGSPSYISGLWALGSTSAYRPIVSTLALHSIRSTVLRHPSCSAGLPSPLSSTLVRRHPLCTTDFRASGYASFLHPFTPVTSRSSLPLHRAPISASVPWACRSALALLSVGVTLGLRLLGLSDTSQGRAFQEGGLL